MRVFTLFVMILLLAHTSKANECHTVEHGSLDVELIAEASGLAISQSKPHLLYHINDSGDGPYLYVTDQDGSNVRKITVSGFIPKDVEDLTLGTCPDGTGNCIYIADIGDNWTLRSHIRIIVIPEPTGEETTIDPTHILKLRYPDEAHNAEGLALHPNGTLYILTKEYNEITRKVQDSKLYYLDLSLIQPNISSYPLSFLTTLPLTTWQADTRDRWSKLPTALDISYDGKYFLVLTYNHAFEISYETVKQSITQGIASDAVKRIDIKRLPQQEAIAYQPASKNFIYTTEGKDSNKTGKAPIMLHHCQ